MFSLYSNYCPYFLCIVIIVFIFFAPHVAFLVKDILRTIEDLNREIDSPLPFPRPLRLLTFKGNCQEYKATIGCEFNDGFYHCGRLDLDISTCGTSEAEFYLKIGFLFSLSTRKDYGKQININTRGKILMIQIKKIKTE